MDTIAQLRNVGPSQYLLGLVVILWLHWLWSRRHIYRFAMQFPGIMGIPIFGVLHKIKHINYLLSSFGKMFEECKANTICIWLGWYPTVVSVDPDLIEKVLSNPELLNKAEQLYSPIHKVCGGGLVASPASKWRHNRKVINPAFQHKVLLTFFPIFNKAIQVGLSQIDSLVDGQEHHLSAIFERLTLGIAVETTMGRVLKAGEKLDEEYTEQIEHIMRGVSSQVLWSNLKLDGLVRLLTGFRKAAHFMKAFVEVLAKERLAIATKYNNNDKSDLESASLTKNNDVEELISVKKQPNIFIDQAIQFNQKNQLTWQDVIAESNIIVIAAAETSAVTIVAALILMAMHPDVQERVFTELVGVFPDKDCQFEYEHIKDLPYLDMVISEVLRVVPAIPIIGRQVVKDTVIDDTLTLPKGLQVGISIFHVHRRKDIWGPNADKFNPDNFLPENIAKIHPYAYIPFSKGIRNCIGWRYAQFSVKVFVARLLRIFRFTTTFKYEDLRFIENISMRFLIEPGLQIHRR